MSQTRTKSHLVALVGLVISFSLASSFARAQSDLPMTPESPRVEADRVDPTVLEQARLLLSGYHGVPDRSVLEAQIPQAREVLLTIALEPDVLPLHRSRAVAAVVQWNDDAVLDALSTLLVGADDDDLLQHHVIMALGTTFGDRALDPLRQCLSDPNVQIRLTAIEALSVVGTPSSRLILEQAWELETSPLVRQRLESATVQLQH